MRQTTLLALILIAGCPAFALDPQLLNMVMPNATELVGINVTGLRDSPLGQYFLSRVPAGDAGLQKLISTTGFDPRQDLSELLLARASQQGGNTGLVLARGNFDVQKITAAVPDGQVQTYDGATFWAPRAWLTVANARANPAAVAFIGNSIAIAGDAALVKAALDRQNMASSLVDPNLTAQAQALSASDDIWVLSLAPGSYAYSPGPAGNASAKQIATLLRSVQSFGGGAKFSDPNVNIAGHAIADTTDNAKALSDVAHLLLTLMAANSTSDPQAAAVVQMLQPIQINADGTALSFSLSMSESQLEAFLTTAADQKAAAARQKHSRSTSAN